MKKNLPSERIKKIHAASQDKVEEAKLRLALLKEKASYRKLFRETFAEYKADTPLPKPDALAFFYQVCISEFDINSYSAKDTRDFLEVLDPSKDIDDDPERARRILPRLFFSPAIRGVTPDGYHECPGSPPLPLSLLALRVRRVERFERLLLLDLRKKRKQLVKEFHAFLDAVDLNRVKAPETYEEWETDRTRARNEAWRHLRIWKARRMRQGFAEIACELNIGQDTAKKSFYRAYEMIEGQSYDPGKFRREYRGIRKAELTRTCETCPDRDSCTVLCPDVLPFVDQDHKSLLGRTGSRWPNL